MSREAVFLSRECEILSIEQNFIKRVKNNALLNFMCYNEIEVKLE